MPSFRRSTYRDTALFAGLALLTLVTYWGVWNAQFVYFDDPAYIYQNLHLRHGLTWENIAWAFTSGYQANWHPLSWLSHLLDVQLYGLNSGGHHVTSLLLHIANTLLLMLLLRRLTGSVWRSAVVAALFAVHPLHVESVAWVSERKDVLSVFFGLGTMLAYAAYCRRPGVLRYAVVVVLYALALMAKPMMVTLPFVLLLLDYWPLGRLWQLSGVAAVDVGWDERSEPHQIQQNASKTGVRCGLPRSSTKLPEAARKSGTPAPQSISRKAREGSPAWLVFEKMPLLLMSAASCVVTYFVQQAGGAVIAEAALPLSARLTDVPVAYVAYLEKIFWPTRLAHHYPFQAAGALACVLAMGLLLLVSAAVLWGARRKYGYLATGWFWFLGTLVPVIGLIKVGGQSIADRYTYFPAVGIFLLVVWGAVELLAAWRYRAAVLGSAAIAAVLVCAGLSMRQAGYWADSETLMRHTLAVTSDNLVTCDDLANVLAMRAPELLRQGCVAEAQQAREEAIRYYQESLRIEPRYGQAHNNWGNVLSDLGKTDEAIEHYQLALQLDPHYAVAHRNLGNRLMDRKRYEEAYRHYRAAAEATPNYVEAYVGWGNACYMLNRPDEALAACQTALRIDPEEPTAHFMAANLLAAKGRTAEALDHCRQAARYAPGNPRPLNFLARILASTGDPSLRNPTLAVRLAEQLCAATQRRNPQFLDTLAMAYADAGRFPEAIAAAREAGAQAASQGMNDLAAEIGARRALYEAGQPFRVQK